jgi:two-component system, cell cycle sensor histidine kinase and response regulator CckA
LSDGSRIERVLREVVEAQREITAVAGDLDATMRAIVERCQRLVGADAAGVEWVEGNEIVLRVVSGGFLRFAGMRMRIDDSVSGRCLETGELQVCKDTETDDRVDLGACRRTGIRSFVMAPLRRNGRAAGNLVVAARSPRAFDDVAVETTRLMGEFVSTAINNAEELAARKALVDALRESEERFRGAFDSAAIGMALTSLEARFVQVNDKLAEMLGYTAEELTHLGVGDVTHPEDIEYDLERAQALLRGEIDSYQREKRYRRKDGTTFPAQLTVALVRDWQGNPTHVVSHVQDLTERKDAEELELQLRQAQKMETVGRLAGGIAHDFNNLLTAIGGYSEFLIAGIDDPALRSNAREIKKASDRAAALTSQLLAFSRRQVRQPRVVDLNTVVEDMQMMLRRLIGEDVELVTLLDPELRTVRADPSQIEQVIVNLAVNARDAMPGGGALTIETSNVDHRELGRCAVLAITDTGVGMTDEERQKLFEPFFTTKGVAGTGLGLATVDGVVAQSGGAIEVDTEPSVGTSFRIYLPRVDEPAPEPARGEAAPLDARAAGDETILLVEDEAIVRRLVAEILEDAGYTVLQAGDGNSALELVRRHQGALDLLVTDVVMPGMSGRDVATAISSLRPGLEVLYMSGYTDSAIVKHGALDPETAFLQKPFSADDLTRKVRSLLDVSETSLSSL